MSDEFTVEEMNEAIRQAQIYCDRFTEAEFRNLLDMKRLLKEKGYLEANEGLVRLAQEGVPPIRALDEYQKREQRYAALEGQISNFESQLQELAEKAREAEAGQAQIKAATRQAQQELAESSAIRDQEKRELEQFRQEAEREKEEIKAEVEQCRTKAQVTQEEIETAAKIKAEVAAHGFSLELILGLAQEFRGHEKMREELADVLHKRQTIKESNLALEEQFKERQQAAQAEMNQLQTETESRHSEIKGLDATRSNLEMVIFKLQEDKTYEDTLRNFYGKYCRVSGLLELLASWDEVYFLRCVNPMSAFSGYFNPKVKNARCWMDKPAIKCPHCGLKMLGYDEAAYRALGRIPGDSRKINLGE
jgi:DNA repair exonuclease SbcCD ATPase subunit